VYQARQWVLKLHTDQPYDELLTWYELPKIGIMGEVCPDTNFKNTDMFDF
jgi:hypothetical protein